MKPFAVFVSIAGVAVLVFGALLASPQSSGARSDADRAEAPASTTPKRSARLLAVGDIHGDYKTFHRLLRNAKIIDAEDRWAAGKRHLVQTGDVVDRGPDSRLAVDLLRRLESEARTAGGRVVVLLGNHEAWVALGYLEYVSPGEIGAFAKDETAELRSRRREAILSMLREPSPLVRSSFHRDLARRLNERTIDRLYPRGFYAFVEAFSPNGSYGKWVRARPIAHREENVLFVHAGLSPPYAAVSIDELNRRARDRFREVDQAVAALEKLDVYRRELGWFALLDFIALERRAGSVHEKLRPHFLAIERATRSVLFANDGPLMYRGLAEGLEQRLTPHVDRLLEFHRSAAVVIGHTQPPSKRIAARFAQRVILIDTGMNQTYYRGTPSVLAVFPGPSFEVWE